MKRSQLQHAKSTSHSSCLLKTCSPSPAVVQLLQAVSSEVLSKSTISCNSSVWAKHAKPLQQALKCSTKPSMKPVPVKTSVSSSAALRKDDVERGMVLAAPGTCTPHTKFKGPVYVLTKEEGGRHKPFFTGYRPQFYFRTTDVTGTVELPAGVEMVMPGDNVEITVELIAPIAMEKGMRFAIREGGRTIGAGTVSKIHQVRCYCKMGCNR